VRADGRPISDVKPAGLLKLNISYTSRYEEIEACIAAHLDWSMWNRNIYTRSEKADVVAWFRDHAAIKLQQDSAVYKAQQKGRKKK